MSATKSIIIAFVLIGAFACAQEQEQQENQQNGFQESNQSPASACPLSQIKNGESYLVRTSESRYVMKSRKSQ